MTPLYREPVHSRSTSVYDLVDCMSSSSLMHAFVMQKLYVQHMYSTELAIVHRTGNSLLDMASPSLVTRPSKNRKEGLGWGGSVHCGMLGILLIV